MRRSTSRHPSSSRGRLLAMIALRDGAAGARRCDDPRRRALTGEPAGFPTPHRMHALVQLEPPCILEGPCVRETMRGGGIATALPADARAFTQAVDAAGIILSAQRDNARAQRVYERTGYVRDDQSFHYAPTVGWAHQTGE